MNGWPANDWLPTPPPMPWQSSNMPFERLEKDVIARFVPALQELGAVSQEEWGTVYMPDAATRSWVQKRTRIDAVITFYPEVDREQTSLGIEFKKQKHKTVEIGKILRQAVDYRHTIWDNYGPHLPILLCPDFRELYGARGVNGFSGSDASRCAEIDKRMLAPFGIGELGMYSASGYFSNSSPAERLWISFAADSWLRHKKRCNYKRQKFGQNYGSG